LCPRLSTTYDCFSVTRLVAVIALLLIVLAGGQQAFAQVSPIESDRASESAVETDTPIDPYESVHEGNILLKDGNFADALERYERAKKAKPDAREIAFAEGLSQYHLGDYERARDLFRKAAAGKYDPLADDATYSIGTTYHSDALLGKDDPKAALSRLEQAMEHYQNVLNHDPDHAAARDAYRKAGTTWHTIKQQMQQQQQQQPSDNQDKNNENKSENQKQDQPKSDQKQEQSEQQDQQQSQDQQQQQSEQDQQQQDQQEQNDQNQQQDEQQSSESQDKQKPEEPDAQQQDQEQQEEKEQKASAEREEQVSQEQAERKLREMMQAIRERKERRRQPTKLVPVRPVDKDW